MDYNSVPYLSLNLSISLKKGSNFISISAYLKFKFLNVSSLYLSKVYNVSNHAIINALIFKSFYYAAANA